MKERNTFPLAVDGFCLNPGSPTTHRLCSGWLRSRAADTSFRSRVSWTGPPVPWISSRGQKRRDGRARGSVLGYTLSAHGVSMPSGDAKRAVQAESGDDARSSYQPNSIPIFQRKLPVVVKAGPWPMDRECCKPELSWLLNQQNCSILRSISFSHLVVSYSGTG